MTNLFTRMTRKEYKCEIQLLINKVESTSNDELDLGVLFERGPQKEETPKFTCPGQGVVVVNHKFQRESGFYMEDEEKGTWYKKECVISLGVYIKDKWTKLQSHTVNMSDMVNKGDCQKVYQFKRG